jgi:Ala-tRNA(Pro) deacylase
MQEQSLLTLFNELQYSYQLHNHEAVFTVEESSSLQSIIPGAHSKNLFLKDRKGSFFLVSVLEHKKVNLKALSKDFGKGGLSFANADNLMEKLKLIPGSVTPYGLMHDDKNEVLFILDQDFLKQDLVNFHPLRNDMTVGMPTQSFLSFLEVIKHPPKIIEIPILN